jgi:hypothetical protein
MKDKPPLLLVLVGVGSIGMGLINGLFFSLWEATLLLGSSELGPPISPVMPGLLGLIDVFSILQIPAGIGILLHRPWGKQLAQGMAFGVTVTGLLGTAPGTLGLIGFPGIITGAFGWGFLTGLAWAIALNVACRFRSMTAPFGEAAARDAPPASVG